MDLRRPALTLGRVARACSFLFLCSALAAGIGCRATPSGVVGDGCKSNLDCTEGVCNLDGLCAPECAHTSECPGTSECVDGVCRGRLVAVDASVADRDAGARLGDGGDVTRDGGGNVGVDGSVASADDGGGSGSDGGGGGGMRDGGGRDQCHDRGARRVCGSNLGTCRTGEQECTGEFWGPCLGAVGPTEEQCDGEDHDCDGVPNNPPGGCACVGSETRACYTGPADTRGVGTCRDGTQTCASGNWGPCEGEVTPQALRCDVASCAGGANPGCGCAPGETRACYDGPAGTSTNGVCHAGTQTCVVMATSAAFGPCENQVLPGAEQCDGMDHDCNGQVDDRAAPNACECRNGQSRACYDGPPETRGVGTCRDGTQACTDGRWGACEGSVKPIPGACLEASCAGTPNPGCACIPGNTRMCYSGDPREISVGICRAGTETCIRGATGAVSWGPCVGERLPETEQCDGADHDCNGTPNDAVGGCSCTNNEVRSCYDGPPGTETLGTCHAGTQVCVTGNWGPCQNQVIPIPGRCDLESCAGGPNPGCLCTLGDMQPCYSGPAGTEGRGICQGGSQRCINFDTGGVGWGACAGERLPEAEQCDGLDHNCNDVPDDRAAPPCECRNGSTRSCWNGADLTGMGTCRAGSQTCVDGRWGTCGGSIEPIPGQCGVASCAGGPNPGCACIVGESRACYDGPAGTLNVGICRGGTQSCLATPTGSAWGACQGQRLPETERCDNQDHDCNMVPNDRPGGCTCVLGQSQSCYTGPAGTAGVGTCHAGTQSCVESPPGTFAWGACTGEVKPDSGNCNVASCTGPNDPNPGCDCINGRSRACYTGPAGTQGVGICVGGNQSCSGGAWGTCGGQTLPEVTDYCVPPSAAYASYVSSDRNCSGTLTRHNPVANPTLSATPSGTVLTPPPAGALRAIEVAPLATVTLSGGATDQDGAGSFSYRWRLLSAPQNNTAGISGAPGATPSDISTQQAPTLFAQLAGDYVVAVRALDSSGCQSDEVQVVVRVKPHASIHIQLTWDQSVDMDLQLVQGATSNITFGTGACYWGAKDPDWGVVDPHLDIDDLAGCNPENINFGDIGGVMPPLNTGYAIWVHYYCNLRGHRTSASNPDVLCYEPETSRVTVPVTVTAKVFVDGVLAKINGTSNDAIFTTTLTQAQTWRPATLLYDASGVWRVTASGTKGTATTTACAPSASCTCSQIMNTSDPYCGTSGAACRQRFP